MKVSIAYIEEPLFYWNFAECRRGLDVAISRLA